MVLSHYMIFCIPMALNRLCMVMTSKRIAQAFATSLHHVLFLQVWIPTAYFFLNVTVILILNIW